MVLTIVSPKADAKFPVGEAVEFDGIAGESISRVELTTDDQFTFPAVTLNGGKWSVANRFQLEGVRKIVATGFDSNDGEAARAEVSIRIEPPDFGRLVPIPAGINKGVTKAKQQTMLTVFGAPGALTDECSSVTNAKLKRLMIRTNVGPFTVEGIKPAVEALTRIFDNVKQAQPALFAQLGTAGMLCCRRIRPRPGHPPSKQFSNHSWGTAVDIKIRGSLDPRGDGKTQLGLLLLHPFFNEEKFFWGAGFGGSFEDSMHFEASDELIKQWKGDAVLG